MWNAYIISCLKNFKYLATKLSIDLSLEIQ